MQEVGASDDEENVSAVVDFSSKGMNDVIFDCEGEGDLRILLGFCGEDGEDWNPRFLLLCGEEEASKRISSCEASIKGWIKLEGTHDYSYDNMSLDKTKHGYFTLQVIDEAPRL